jgi:hypothetical protein
VVWQWQRSRSDRRRSTGAGIGQSPAASEDPADRQPLGPLADPEFVAGLRPIPSATSAGTAFPAPDIEGSDPSGRPVRIDIGEYAQPILLAFLHIDCDGCGEFWQGLADDRGVLPAEVSAVIVTKGPDTVPPGDVGQASAGIGRVPVVMSDGAWTDYRVLGYPFFVLVDPATRTVVGETVGFGWTDVISMISSPRT